MDGVKKAYKREVGEDIGVRRRRRGWYPNAGRNERAVRTFCNDATADLPAQPRVATTYGRLARASGVCESTW